MNAFLPEEDIQQDINFNEQESKLQIKTTRNEIKTRAEVLNYYLKIINGLIENKENFNDGEEVYEIILKDFIAMFNINYEKTIILIKDLKNLIKKDKRYSLEMPEATEIILRIIEKDYFKDFKLFYQSFKQNLFHKNDYLKNIKFFIKALLEYDIFIKMIEMYDN